MKFQLPSNATLRDVTTTHFNIDHFTAVVRETMRQAQKQYGPVVVRIGVTGAGKLPNFRLEATSGSWRSAYDGVSRQPFDARNVDSNWSTATMSFEEVETLLRELRNYFK